MHFPNKEIKFVEGGHAFYYEHNAELYNSVISSLKKTCKVMHKARSGLPNTTGSKAIIATIGFKLQQYNRAAV